MATYKKRGYKPKTKAEKESVDSMSGENSATAEVFNTLDQGASKTEAWVEKNQKIILGVVGVVAIAVIGYILYQKFIQEPKQAEAVDEMFQAQSYYERALTNTAESDSLFRLSINGYGGKYGFKDIVEKYGSTATGNSARYYAGMAHLRTGNYQEAIDYLDDYKGKDGITGAQAEGAIGDAFAQLNQKEEALKYYAKAVAVDNNDVTTPRYLLKAGIVALDLGKKADALKYFTQIVEDFDASTEAAKAKVYKGQAEAMQ